MEMASPDREDLGLGLKPGDLQYRAYVGPPEDYDLIAAMTFNLLTTLGLRQHHSLLDVGCGSLRIGPRTTTSTQPASRVRRNDKSWKVPASASEEAILYRPRRSRKPSERRVFSGN